MSRGDHVTRGDVEQICAEWGESFLRSLLKVLAPGGLEDPALVAARQRAAELRATDPVLADQVAAVRDARESGAHVTVGADPGRRTGPGVMKISMPTEADDEGHEGTALAAVRRKLRRGRTDED